MSGSIPESAEHETDLLVAEYVLGTLEPSDRAVLAREAETNPGIRRAIETWERHLAPLNRVSDPVTPPDALWPRIETSAWGGTATRPTITTSPTARGGAIPDRSVRSLRVWRGAAAVGFALAAAVAGFALLRPPPPLPAAPLVTALLPLGQQDTTVFIAETTTNGELSVRPVGALHVAPDRDLEFWLLRNGEKVPKALGLLRGAGLRVAAGNLPRGGGDKILVSLEPLGGSPTGLPTGPVLYGGSF